MILEGLNVLQTVHTHPTHPKNGAMGFVSDYFDFSIYVDAPTATIEEWYVTRFLTFRDTAFRDPASYFHRYASVSDEEARSTARRIWRDINAVNLHHNIAPTRKRANLILEKGPDHSVRRVRLRKL